MKNKTVVLGLSLMTLLESFVANARPLECTTPVLREVQYTLDLAEFDRRTIVRGELKKVVFGKVAASQSLVLRVLPTLSIQNLNLISQGVRVSVTLVENNQGAMPGAITFDGDFTHSLPASCFYAK